MALERYAAAAPGTENHAKDDWKAPCRTVRSFTNREAIRIIGDSHFTIQGGGKILLEPLSVQPSRICILHPARRGNDGSRDTNADRSALADRGFEFRHQARDGGHCPGVIAPRGWHPYPF